MCRGEACENCCRLWTCKCAWDLKWPCWDSCIGFKYHRGWYNCLLCTFTLGCARCCGCLETEEHAHKRLQAEQKRKAHEQSRRAAAPPQPQHMRSSGRRGPAPHTMSGSGRVSHTPTPTHPAYPQQQRQPGTAYHPPPMAHHGSRTRM